MSNSLYKLTNHQEAINAMLSWLPDRESEILCLRLGLGDGKKQTYKQIGEETGLSPCRARQIAVKALYEIAAQLERLSNARD